MLLQTLIIIMKIFNLNVGLNTQNTVHGHLLVFHLGSFAKYILFLSPLPPLFIIFPGKQICLIYGMPELKLAIYKWLLIDMATQLRAVTETSSSFEFFWRGGVRHLLRLLSVEFFSESPPSLFKDGFTFYLLKNNEKWNIALLLSRYDENNI